MYITNDNDGSGKTRNNWGKVVLLTNPSDIRGWNGDNFMAPDFTDDPVAFTMHSYRRRLYARSAEGDSNVPKRLNGAAPRVFVGLLLRAMVTGYRLTPETRDDGNGNTVMVRTAPDAEGNSFVKVSVDTDNPIVGIRVSVLRRVLKHCKVSKVPAVGDGLASYLVGWETPDEKGQGGGFHVDSLVPWDVLGTFLGNEGLAFSSKKANRGARILIPGANDDLRQKDLAHIVSQTMAWKGIDADIRNTEKVSDAMVTVVWGRQQLAPERYELATHVAADRIALGAAAVEKGEGMNAVKAKGVLHLAGNGKRECAETTMADSGLTEDAANDNDKSQGESQNPVEAVA